MFNILCNFAFLKKDSMLKYIFIILCSVLLITSCNTTKVKTQPKIIKKVIRDTVFIEKPSEDKIHSAELKNYTIVDEHFPAHGQDYRQKFLIMHYTALHNERSAEVLTTQSVSSHYLVKDNDDDKIHVLVDEDRRAWHAGVSSWRGRTNINDSSIGIEIVNLGFSTRNNEMWFYPYPEHQFKKVAELAKDIVERYDIAPTFVLGHSDIAPARKQDPGAFFPWKRLYEEYNVGAWYNDIDKYKFLPQYPRPKINTRKFIKSYQEELQQYGYNIEITGSWDKQTKLVTQAFQMHFRPSNYSGKIDAETWAIIKALNHKYLLNK